MAFNSPSIETFKVELVSSIDAIQKMSISSHGIIKIQSLLNITIYVLATRFLEGSIKHIIYNCCILRGDNNLQLASMDSELKKFNNPEFKYIRDFFLLHLNFDIIAGLTAGLYSKRDISLLDEIVTHRHRNVHASYDPTRWYNVNTKDLNSDFKKEFIGLLNILTYLDFITWDGTTSAFKT